MPNLSEAELVVLLNSLNHLISQMSDAEFHTVVGIPKSEAQALLEKKQSELRAAQ